MAEFISSLKDGDEVADAVFPSYLSTFISEYFNTPAEDDFLHEDRLAALYYAYAIICSDLNPEDATNPIRSGTRASGTLSTMQPPGEQDSILLLANAGAAKAEQEKESSNSKNVG